ncbi:glycosyltransferase family 4 protein [Aerococcus sp. Group 1]|uniref:glycosyltransferase family 4 protein n=1 Tax=Aerococcus urinae (strain CCUG 59500 / ACS-120-V-Col10a) TaxID=2976812 RepID=UPI00227C82A4|nr:glycosyltransferase family 4 protein [Aerococcus sp. Group 1]MCY3030594.1 glycosyltransferase family 4 protein [Aerococcus sp. Group 1]
MIAFIGDFHSNDGVANANKNIKNGIIESKIKNQFLFSKETHPIKRIIEIFKLVYNTEKICFSGITKVNILIIMLAKIFNKKIYYLLHGYPAYEQSIEGVLSPKKLKQLKKNELRKYQVVDGIICVSETCAEYIKKELPRLSDKIFYINNPIDTSHWKKEKNNNRDRTAICTTGGGRRIKNNLTIAKAVSKLNAEGYNLSLYVLGSNGPDTELLKEENSVKYLGKHSHEDTIKLFQKTNIYIQNSYFETFGLAVLEALFNGNNLLISKNVGARDVLENLQNSDVINDNQNIEEITEKIKNILVNSNNRRLYNGLNQEKISPENVAYDLYDILKR